MSPLVLCRDVLFITGQIAQLEIVYQKDETVESTMSSGGWRNA